MPAHIFHEHFKITLSLH